MPRIIASKSAHPRHKYEQSEIMNHFGELCPREFRAHLKKFFSSVGIDSRTLALPIDAYEKIHGFGDRLKLWNEIGLSLCKESLQALFDDTGVDQKSIGQIFFTSVTGMSAPSMDAKLCNEFNFREDIKRTPNFGLGCLAGAALISRANDYLQAYPKESALVVALEICSLTLQRDDFSVSSAIGAALFGDGCASVLLVGDEHELSKERRGFNIKDSAQIFFKDTQNVMGWDFTDTGPRLVLSNEVSTIAKERLCPKIKQFLNDHRLSVSDISHWVGHPGGPKVIAAIEEGLELNSNALKYSRESLSKFGNLSSASVLCVLEDILKDPHQQGDYGLLFAMGPAFCAEMLLLQC